MVCLTCVSPNSDPVRRMRLTCKLFVWRVNPRKHCEGCRKKQGREIKKKSKKYLCSGCHRRWPGVTLHLLKDSFTNSAEPTSELSMKVREGGLYVHQLEPLFTLPLLGTWPFAGAGEACSSWRTPSVEGWPQGAAVVILLVDLGASPGFWQSLFSGIWPVGTTDTAE